MSLKDILVHLDASTRSRARLAFAVGLAKSYSAHLTAIHVIPPPSAVQFYGDPSADMRFVEEMTIKQREQNRKDTARIEWDFHEWVQHLGIKGDWLAIEGFAAEIVALHARCADVAILGQRDPGDTSLAAGGDVTATTLLESGRPVLVLPYAGGYPTIWRKVLVGWNNTREASRAVNDALPLLRQADEVIVLSIFPEVGHRGEGDAPARDIALHLGRHSVKASAAARTITKDLAASILSYADEVGADLIVAGGYGHSRVRELVFGGVTRTLLNKASVPVFLSH
jgi:nucleotide-binding universal stress UspA family protein